MYFAHIFDMYGTWSCTGAQARAKKPAGDRVKNGLDIGDFLGDDVVSLV